MRHNNYLLKIFQKKIELAVTLLENYVINYREQQEREKELFTHLKEIGK
jgi:hypothetical protein